MSIALGLAALAALLHVYIWYLESLAWTAPATRAIFGTTEDEAATTRFLAFNQGFYNLFLAILVALGIAWYAAGSPVVGRTLAMAGVASMLAAALVLGVSSAAHRKAALRQGLLPALALALMVVA